MNVANHYATPYVPVVWHCAGVAEARPGRHLQGRVCSLVWRNCQVTSYQHQRYPLYMCRLSHLLLLHHMILRCGLLLWSFHALWSVCCAPTGSFLSCITSIGHPVWAPGLNLPLIRFLILALYILFACLYLLFCAYPFCFTFSLLILFYEKRLAWGTSPKWPILCWVGRKTTTQSISRHA